MPNYLAPGVYVEEIDTGSKPIEGVSTSIAGMIGVTERGPVNVPILIASIGDYNYWFGGRLRIADFSNGNGAHCYLPHAVEGFFTNQGQELYVTRILDLTLATPASTFLFDRGTPGTQSTILFRATAEGTGAAASPPALVLLKSSVLTSDPSPTPNPPWFRVGDGSTADYVQADPANPAVTDVNVPLVRVISRAHPSKVGVTPEVDEFPRATDSGYSAPFSILTPTLLPTAANATGLTVKGSSGDITRLMANVGQLIEIASGAQVEYRFVVNAVALPGSTTNPAGTTAFVTLDSGLAMSYPTATTSVTPLLVTALGGAFGTLAVAASPGDAVVFPVALPTASALVMLDRSDLTNREVRLVGQLFEVDLPVAGAYAEYPAGSAVASATLSDDDLILAGSAIAASPAGATESGGTVTITTTAAHGLVVGQTVLVAGVGVAGYNGTFTVASVPSATTFTYAAATGLAASGGGTATAATAITVTGIAGLAGSAIAASPAGATESGSTVTITTTAAHGLVVGQTVLVAGVGVAGYNGTFTVASVPSATTFTYAAATGLAASGGGTATAATAITVTDVTGLAVGMTITVDPAGVNQPLLIQSVTPDPAPKVSGTITFTPALNAGVIAGKVILQPPGAILTAAAAAGATLIALNSRLGLSEGDVIRIGPIGAAEFMTVAALPAAGGPAPDPGNVVLTAPLANAWPVNTLIRRQTVLAVLNPGATVLPAAQGDVLLVATASYHATDLIQINTPDGEVYFHYVTQDSISLTPSDVYINTQWPLYNAHAVGEIVVPRNPLLKVQALDAGAWGNRLQVAVQDEPAGLVSGTTLAAIISPTKIKLASSAGVEIGTVLELSTPDGTVVGNQLKVIAVSKTDQTITLDFGGLTADQQNAFQAAKTAGQALGVNSREFRIAVTFLRQPDPALPTRNTTVLDTEVWPLLSMDPRHSRYVQTIIGAINGPKRLSDGRPDGQSWYIRVQDLAPDQKTLWSIRPGPEALVDTLPTGQVRPARRKLEGGDDSIDTINDATYIGQDAADPKDRTGLFTLMNVDEISIVACPGRTSPEMQGAVISHCENMLYRFAVLDGPPPPDDALADVMAQRQQFDTKYAALYYPWLTIDDPYPTNLNNIAPFAIPPSGHVAGVYARVDNDQGVQKAPANEVVSGITGLQRTLYKAQQDILNPYPVNINVIRDFRTNDRGIVVYGARVITSDTDWKYVNVRRLLIFIERSLLLGLQWAVFEVNYEPLWARVRRSITNFLTTVWRNGALQGDTAAEAFFVKCDQTTMTQTDIDNGRLIAVIGVAPVKPAEYVIIRIGLWAGPTTT